MLQLAASRPDVSPTLYLSTSGWNLYAVSVAAQKSADYSKVEQQAVHVIELEEDEHVPVSRHVAALRREAEYTILLSPSENIATSTMGK